MSNNQKTIYSGRRVVTITRDKEEITQTPQKWDVVFGRYGSFKNVGTLEYQYLVNKLRGAYQHCKDDRKKDEIALLIVIELMDSYRTVFWEVVKEDTARTDIVIWERGMHRKPLQCVIMIDAERIISKVKQALREKYSDHIQTEEQPLLSEKHVREIVDANEQRIIPKDSDDHEGHIMITKELVQINGSVFSYYSKVNKENGACSVIWPSLEIPDNDSRRIDRSESRIQEQLLKSPTSAVVNFETFNENFKSICTIPPLTGSTGRDNQISVYEHKMVDANPARVVLKRSRSELTALSNNSYAFRADTRPRSMLSRSHSTSTLSTTKIDPGSIEPGSIDTFVSSVQRSCSTNSLHLRVNEVHQHFTQGTYLRDLQTLRKCSIGHGEAVTKKDFHRQLLESQGSMNFHIVEVPPQSTRDFAQSDLTLDAFLWKMERQTGSRNLVGFNGKRQNACRNLLAQEKPIEERITLCHPEPMKEWSLTNLHVTKGSSTPTACVTLANIQGVSEKATQQGNCTTATVCKAIDEIVNLPWIKFESATSNCFCVGTVSQITATAVVKNVMSEETFSGTFSADESGIASTNFVADATVIASAYAYVDAINQYIISHTLMEI